MLVVDSFVGESSISLEVQDGQFILNLFLPTGKTRKMISPDIEDLKTCLEAGEGVVNAECGDGGIDYLFIDESCITFYHKRKIVGELNLLEPFDLVNYLNNH